MINDDQIQIFNVDKYPEVSDVLEKYYVKSNTIHLELKKPNIDKIHVTIVNDYTKLRRQIENLLKEKGVDVNDRRRILKIVDINDHLIYPVPKSIASDQRINFNEAQQSETYLSDSSDLSDPQDIETLTVSECIKRNSGKVKVGGNIISLSQSIKMVSKITRNCECGRIDNKQTVYDPPLYGTGTESKPKCQECNENFSVDHRNAFLIQLQDDEKFNDIDRINCVLLDIDASNIRLGERVYVIGDLHVEKKFGKGLLVPIIYGTALEYKVKESSITTEFDVKAIERFAKLKGESIIDALIDMFDNSIIDNNAAKEAFLYGLVSVGDDLKEIDASHSRTRINMLLVGPPGHAKSSLMRKASKLISNSRYESAQHSSAKSLTAIVSKIESEFSLMLGPIPIARGSVACLNEIGSLQEEDQKYLFDIMEEGKFTINKYGNGHFCHSKPQKSI